jgi:predicted RND superfamily exporter protein
MGRAITLAAFTTMAGFGSLFFSSYQGLSEMGMAVSIGCFLTLMFTLVLIPVLMRKHLVLNKA